MSNRRSAAGRSAVSRSFTEDEVNDLILKLQALLPDSTSSSSCNSRASASRILKETCSYIKKLHKEVDYQSDRLSQLLASGEITNIDAAADHIIRTILQDH